MDTELESIINQLISKTKAGEVIWNKTATPNEFCLFLNAATILTHMYYVKTTSFTAGVKMAECVVKNIRGDIVMRANSAVDSEDGELLYSLYDSAFRAYTGKDEVVASILGQLESSGQIGTAVDKTSDDLPF